MKWRRGFRPKAAVDLRANYSFRGSTSRLPHLAFFFFLLGCSCHALWDVATGLSSHCCSGSGSSSCGSMFSCPSHSNTAASAFSKQLSHHIVLLYAPFVFRNAPGTPTSCPRYSSFHGSDQFLCRRNDFEWCIN